MGKEDIPTGSSVYPLLVNLMVEDLQNCPDHSPLVREFKSVIKKGLARRFLANQDGQIKETALDNPLLKASALDPCYKSLKFMKAEQRI